MKKENCCNYDDGVAFASFNPQVPEADGGTQTAVARHWGGMH